MIFELRGRVSNGSAFPIKMTPHLVVGPLRERLLKILTNCYSGRLVKN